MIVFDTFSSTDFPLFWNLLEKDDHCPDFLEGFGSGQVFDAQWYFNVDDMFVSLFDGQGNIGYLDNMYVVAIIEILFGFSQIFCI